ncbi:MAG: isoprenylcysteine carboxylmethyltransferase family protein [Actinomycetota bacterium]|nr:isoprenylcysteine carboxylmethyltransferase family protein [Actinomycetota bacterium]
MTQRLSVEDATERAKPRLDIDRRVAAALFVLLTVGRPIDTAEMLGRALDAPALRTWLLFGDSALKTLVWVAFAVFIYKRKPSRRPARSPVAFIACAAAILPAILLAAPGADADIWAVVVGEGLVIAAVAFTLASVLALGTCFGVLPEVRGLVTRGPYRFVRHPVYVGEIVAFAGFVVASQRLVNVIPLIVFCAAQMVRLRLEEAALLAEFPDEYGAFAKRTPRLVPRPSALFGTERKAQPARGSEAVAPVA